MEALTGYFLHKYYRITDGPIGLDTRVCYKGTKWGAEVLCDDLPDWLDPRNVATWDPIGKARHVMEWLFNVVGAIILLNLLLRNYQGRTRRKTWARRPLPWFYFLCACYHMYKYDFYMGLPQRGWATTPCHAGWITRLTMHFVPLPEWLQDTICQVLLAFSSLAALFVFEDGEVGDAMYDGVFTWSLIHHILLVTIPLYDVCTGRVAALPPVDVKGRSAPFLKHFMKWHLVSVATYCILYAGIATPLSLMSGVNWGWTIHFHPNKVAYDLGLTSPNYRVVWFVLFNFWFTLCRLMWCSVDWTLRQCGLSVYSRSKVIQIRLEMKK